MHTGDGNEPTHGTVQEVCPRVTHRLILCDFAPPGQGEWCGAWLVPKP